MVDIIVKLSSVASVSWRVKIPALFVANTLPPVTFPFN